MTGSDVIGPGVREAMREELDALPEQPPPMPQPFWPPPDWDEEERERREREQAKREPELEPESEPERPTYPAPKRHGDQA